MKLKKVNPAKILVPEVRVTAQFDEELWEQFQASMREVGQIAPIICCYIDSQYVLVDGLHRLKEAVANNQESVDVALIEGDMVDVLTKNIFLDHLRGKTPVTQMVKVIEALWKEYGLDSEKIAAKTGLTRDYVENLQLISELTPLARTALDEGEFGVGIALQLIRIKDPIDQEKYLGWQRMYHWHVKELKAAVDTYFEVLLPHDEAKAAEPAGPPTKIKCFFCQGEFDISRIANPNTCIECSGVMIATLAQARRELELEQQQQSEPRGG